MYNQNQHARHAYLLLIDGLPWAWSSHPDINQDWWNIDDRIILPGLQVPNLKFSIDIEAGVIEDETTTFKILDADETVLLSFFGNLEKSFSLIGERLDPKTDPAPSSIIGQYGNPITLWDGTVGSYIGLEAIGPNGERRYYSCWPNQLTVGLDHNAYDIPLPIHTTSSIGPYLIEGRKACLFRLFYDEDDKVWTPFSTDSTLNRPLWWGTLKQAGTVDGKTWSIQFSGPASWLRKTLNAKAPNKWYRVQGQDLELKNSETNIWILTHKAEYLGNAYVYGKYIGNIVDGDIDTVLASVTSAVSTAAAAVGPDGVWNDATPIVGTNPNLVWTKDYISISTAGDSGYAAYFQIKLHYKVWKFLGWDPEQQLYDSSGPQPYFEPDLNDKGYYYAVITTTPFGRSVYIPDGLQDWDGDGKAKIYNTLYQGGITVLSGKGNQWIKIGNEEDISEPIYCETQLIRPPKSSASVDTLDCNSTRWWAVKGKIQKAIGLGKASEPEDTIQIAKVSWYSNDGTIYKSDGLNADVFIEHWADPKLFGLNYEKIDSQLGWAGANENEDGGLYMAPLAVFGIWSEKNPISGKGTDILSGLKGPKTSGVFTRLLMSSGTAEWDGVVDDPGDSKLLIQYPSYSYLTTGDYGTNDWDIADLGLALPISMVDVSEFISIINNDLENFPSLTEVKCSAFGPVQSEDILVGLMSPNDWSLSLAGGKYGVFRRSADIPITFVDQTLTISDYSGNTNDPGLSVSVDLRPVYPFDQVILKQTANPIETPTEGQNEKKLKARDIGAFARQGIIKRDVNAPYLPERTWWTTVQAPVYSSELDLKKLWEQETATWLSKPHRGIFGLKISRPKGQYIYPGSTVQLSIPLLPSPSGQYGMSNVIGRVISVTHESDSCDAVLDILIQATPSDRLIWAPIAKVVDNVANPENRHDPSIRTFFLKEWSAIGDNADTSYNVDGFVKPSWSSDEGNAKFTVLQYDGTDWYATCTGFVEDVTTDTLVYTDDGLVGTWYNRMYAMIVITPYDDSEQADWIINSGVILGPKEGLTESKKLPKF